MLSDTVDTLLWGAASSARAEYAQGVLLAFQWREKPLVEETTEALLLDRGTATVGRLAQMLFLKLKSSLLTCGNTSVMTEAASIKYNVPGLFLEEEA